ncbi:MAG: fumarate hydratase [Candidatus Omnitrophica bacterium]|nr:fumarate hydratase [Candidatus Omnitrophota bacterium]MCF7877473.1 fumarate hydratase [Candidatus Omnitrophota bacterium]MCF7878384.1 fumarate hydratase [Candidatus Omnitrophota bacterium]MCF7892842.1 fumarate hydratase [Candidatus Omnitrophota bacterium]
MNKKQKELREKIKKLVKEANFSLRVDLKKLISDAFSRETKKMPRQALGWILDNAETAKKNKVALCQDTGLPIVFIEAGRKQEIDSSLINTIKKEVSRGYKDNYLRRSIVDPLLRRKPKYQGVISHLQFLPKVKGIRITLFPKGFGSENKTQLKMFNPTANINQIEDFIVDAVKKAGPESCPPFFVGVGIGGTSDQALFLAKKALINRVDLVNPDKYLNTLEKRILKKINKLKIGPMGFGGKFTALAVKIKKCPTHIAGLPVGVNISCHALRSASTVIKL